MFNFYVIGIFRELYQGLLIQKLYLVSHNPPGFSDLLSDVILIYIRAVAGRKAFYDTNANVTIKPLKYSQM